MGWNPAITCQVFIDFIGNLKGEDTAQQKHPLQSMGLLSMAVNDKQTKICVWELQSQL